MGYIKHDTIVVTSWDGDNFASVHRKAKELLGSIGGCDLVSDVVGETVNGQCSFFIAPDGSKEGWDASDSGDEARAAFLEWFKREASVYAEALVVRFGGDDDELTCRVVQSERRTIDA